MEPVTHVLTGVCLARCGLNRRAAYATLAMAVAAEFPDIDTLWGLAGPVAGFAHHRGITHTFAALPVEAAVITAGVYALHHWRANRPRKNSAKPLTQAPVRWGMLFGFCLLALLSHLFLDFTNNYGIRPFAPFNPHWYAGSFVFIFDPLLFALLLLPVIVPPLLALISGEVGVRQPAFRGRGIACTVLVLLAGYWGLRAIEHQQAITLAQATTVAAPTPSEPPAPLDDTAALPTPPAPVYLQPRRVAANPDPFNPFRWYVTLDFGSFYRFGEANTHRSEFTLSQQIFTNPPQTPALLAAEQSPLGRAYLDWSPTPLLSVAQDLAALQDPATANGTETDVTLQDPRFMADVPFLRSRTASPLTAKIDLDAHNRVLQQTLDGRSQR